MDALGGLGIFSSKKSQNITPQAQLLALTEEDLLEENESDKNSMESDDDADSELEGLDDDNPSDIESATPLFSIALLRRAQTLMMCILMDWIGGQRRQVVAGIRKDHITWDADGRCTVKLGKEKATNRTSQMFPIPKEVGELLQLFVTHIRPLLLQSGKSEPLTLWIGNSGAALSGSGFTRQLKRVCKRFHPELDITPILWRRAVVTDMFKGVYDLQQLGQDVGIEDLFRFLNVSMMIAQKYYNRWDTIEVDRRIQELFNQHTVMATKDALGEALAVARTYASVHPAQSNHSVACTPPSARLPRLVLDNKEWERLYEVHKRQKERTKKENKKMLWKHCATEEERRRLDLEREEKEKERIAKVEEMRQTVTHRNNFMASERMQEEVRLKRKRAVQELQVMRKLHVTVSEEMEGRGRKEQSVKSSGWHYYDVKKLTDKGVNSEGRLFYQVKWKGVRRKTWEPAAELRRNCGNLIDLYEVRHWNEETAGQSKEKRQCCNWKDVQKLEELEQQETEFAAAEEMDQTIIKKTQDVVLPLQINSEVSKINEESDFQITSTKNRIQARKQLITKRQQQKKDLLKQMLHK